MRGARLIFFAACFVCLGKFCHRQTGGFSCSKIVFNFPSSSQDEVYPARSKTWNLERAKAPGIDDRKSVHISNIDRLTIVDPRELSRCSKSKFLAVRGIKPPEGIQKILNQEFRYFKRGAQCFVFLSEDKEYVLKIFNNRHLKQLRFFSFLPFSYERKRMLEEQIDRSFQSYTLATNDLSNETGVLYAHLSLGNSPPLELRIVDKLGIRHSLSSKETGFLLQKRGTLFYPSLIKKMAEGRLEEAKEMISSLTVLISRCQAKGVANQDPSVRKNVGMIDNRCVIFDVGRFSKDDLLKDPLYAQKKKCYHLRRFRKWLLKNYPHLIEHFDRECQA